MKRKVLMLAACGVMVLGMATGCRSEKNLKNDGDNTLISNVKNKEIVCTGETEQTSQNEVEFQQSYTFHFDEMDEITTFDMIQNIKILKDNEENRKQLSEQDKEYYEKSLKSMFEYADIDIPDFNIVIEDISSLEKKVIITFDYKDCVELLAGKDDEEATKYTNFEDFSKYILKEITNDMSCTYDGKEIK